MQNRCQFLSITALAVQFEEKIYIIGGFLGLEKTATDSLFIYDPAKDEWTEGARLPSPRGALGSRLCKWNFVCIWWFRLLSNSRNYKLGI